MSLPFYSFIFRVTRWKISWPWNLC